MAWGPPKRNKRAKPEYPGRGAEAPVRSGGISSPYDHTPDDETPFDEAMQEMFADPDPQSSQVTPMRVTGMAELVKLGNAIPVAATSMKIKPAVWKLWVERARRDKARGACPGFGEGESAELFWLDEMDAARAQCEASLVATIFQAAQHDWKAAHVLLQTRYSRRWHLQSKLEITASQGNKVEISSMSTEKLLTIAKGLLPESSIKETKALSADISDGELLDEDLEK